MSNEITKVRVRFVKHRGEVFAVIRDVWDRKAGKWIKDTPYNLCKGHAVVTCYAHVGQHFEAEYAWTKQLRPASPEEFRPLLNELTSIGYDVTVLNRAWYHTNRKGVLP